MHPEPESENRTKNADFLTAKNVPKTGNTFSLFLNEFLQLEPEAIYCSLTYLSFRECCLPSAVFWPVRSSDKLHQGNN